MAIIAGMAGAMPPAPRKMTANSSLLVASGARNIDSVRCGSGAAASDENAAIADHSTDRRRFAPRWHAGSARVVTVRIDSASSIAGWTPAYRTEVLSALDAWQTSGSPFAFSEAAADEQPDVRIHWIDKFDARYDGWTTVSWDQSGWLIGADVTLAVHSPKGQLLTSGERAQVMLHEIGHALGLSHSSNVASIMLPNVKVTAIGAMDIKTLRALYAPDDSSEFALSMAQLAGAAQRCGAANASDRN